MPPTSKTARKPAAPRQTKLNFGAASSPSPKASASKPKKPANGNILNFFKKIEVEEPLFIDGSLSTFSTPETKQHEAPEDVHGGAGDVDDAVRFHEDGGASKRQKTGHDGASLRSEVLDHIAVPGTELGPAEQPATQKKANRAKGKRRGPFLEDSDEELDPVVETPTKDKPPKTRLDGTTTEEPRPRPDLLRDESCVALPSVPPAKEEDPPNDERQDLDSMNGLLDADEVIDEGDFNDGEEYRAMRYMQQQARLEADALGDHTLEAHFDAPWGDDSMTEKCPICDAILVGITPDEATIHVNACLDGNPVPARALTPANRSPESVVESSELSKRFSRAAVPRPGQANPIEIGQPVVKATSAFSKLMSSHAEDAAWVSAAATENSSRGKPAYKRTCPFYKIMPGFSICVDAFRYGAVQGCNAYFLSHFHSDHYVGLSASWSHGPVYCSKVTGSLVKQQLRTDAKWVVELEFEEKFEIPGTDGATVTMLPANHCPGSSLFLFEKAMGGDRSQRILHCGDFRACPAQVQHPLLRPNIMDALSGGIKQQKIDVCYLDTTYLNPRYSFPPQDDVISACAEFCKTISGDPHAIDDAYDALKRDKGSTSVSQFFTKDTSHGGDAEATAGAIARTDSKHRLLVVCGTYSIGKERICKAIAQALQTKIFASPSKQRIIKQLGDPELSALLTSDPRAAQVHMQMIMEIRAETLQEYLNSYKPHFSRIVGFRPSGWNFRSPSSTASHVPANVSPSTVATTQLLHGPAWRTRFGSRDFVAQRGSTREAMCFGVPYSEHSSFRELALFVMSLRIEKVVPTVNIGSEQSRKRMKGWLDRWLAERRRGGIVEVLTDGVEAANDENLWQGKDGKGGAVHW